MNSTDQLLKSTQLTLDRVESEEAMDTILINDCINHALRVTQIYHIETYLPLVCDKLIEILHLLPEVKSLCFYSLLIEQEEIECLAFLLTETKIKKMKELYMIALVCSSINHLDIQCINYEHVQGLTGLILSQIKSETSSSLRLVCFSLQEAHDEMVEKLEKMIDENNLRFDFVIKRVKNKIYIEWK